MLTIPIIDQPPSAHASTRIVLNVNELPVSSSSYDCDHMHNSGRPRSPDINPFLSPPLSSLTIAGSSQYIITYLSLLFVCIITVIVAESNTLLTAIQINMKGQGYVQLLTNGPELLERILCYGALAVSVLALSRRFLSQRQQDSAVSVGAMSCLRRVVHALCYPTHLIEACLIIWLLFFLHYFFFTVGQYFVGHGNYYLSIAFAPGILIPVSIVHFWYSCTEAHSPNTTAMTSTSSVARPAAPRCLPRLWRCGVSMVLLVVMFTLSTDKYVIMYYGTFTNSDSTQLALVYLASLFLCAVAVLVLLIADRHQIVTRQLDFSLPYFALLLALQLRLPHCLYEGWVNFFMPFYNGCGTSTIDKVLVLAGYHLLLNGLQVVVRILSLLCVVPQHSLAMVYYIQWFEDLMADLTFFSVEPFSLLFFINALMTMIKSLIRDCNGIRLLVRACIHYHRSRKQQAKKIDNYKPIEKITTCLSTSAAISTSAVITTINSTMTESRIRRNNQPISASVAEDEATSGGSGNSNTSSVMYVLYQEYIKCFDLILTRHQTFLGESCSKCLIISVIVCQIVSSNAGTLGWHINSNNYDKLISAAGFGFLWFSQLFTHMIVLQLLTMQCKPAAAVYASASVVSPTQESTPGSTPSCSGVSTTASTTQSPADCFCPSCILSYERYIQALQQPQDRRDTDAAAESTRDYVANPKTGNNLAGACCVSADASAASLLPSVVVHPCINYWWIHRWFFAVQMMHWIWFVLVDETVNYGTCV